MSWESFARTLKRSPQLAAAAERIVERLRTRRKNEDVDPLLLASEAGVSEVLAVATLGSLVEANLGRFSVVVLDERGREVGRFASLNEVKDELEDDFGDRITVLPQNVRIVFRSSIEGTSAGQAMVPAT